MPGDFRRNQQPRLPPRWSSWLPLLACCEDGDRRSARSAALIGSFWHESSANEPSGTTRPGRARSLGAAGVAAMTTGGGLTRFVLPPAGRDQRGRLHDHGADRSAVPGAAVLRLAADGGVAGDPGPCRQPQTSPASDAARRPGGDLPATEHEHAGGGPQDLPLPAGWAFDRAGQSGLVLGRHLHPDGQGLPLPGGDHGLGEPCRAGVATVEHARRGVLCRGTRGSALPIRQACDLQYRPEPALAKAGGSQFTSDDFTDTLKRHAITISMDGKSLPPRRRGAATWTTSSSSGCGAASNTRRSTSTPMPVSPRPRPASAPGSAFITRSASTRAWAIARRVRPTKQNARGYVDDRLRRPAAPSPTSPPAQPPTTGLILTRGKVEAMS